MPLVPNQRTEIMSGIGDLCFKLEHVLDKFELCSGLKIDEIRITRNSIGAIESVEVISSGEYRNED